MVDRTIATNPEVPTTGRLAILTGITLAASAIPVPFLPDRVITHVRGTIVQDVAARHGLSLTSDARRVFAESNTESPVKAVAMRAVGFLSKTFVKRLSPLSALVSASSAVEVFALGHLLGRYIEQHRGSKAVRMHADEARAVRKLIENAVVRAFSPALRPEPVPMLPGVEDLRDEFTRWIDTVLLAGASLPSYLERRLDAALDELVAEQGAPA